jgi:hypothetical protein
MRPRPPVTELTPDFDYAADPAWSPGGRNFRATSVSSGYAGGSFALTSTGTYEHNDGIAGAPYNCVVKSGSLVFSPNGSFEGTNDFDCSAPWSGSFSLNVIETGFYAVSDSTIVLHYVNSNDTVGFIPDSRDAHGVMSEDKIVFSSLGVEWRYMRLDEVARP